MSTHEMHPVTYRQATIEETLSAQHIRTLPQRRVRRYMRDASVGLHHTTPEGRKRIVRFLLHPAMRALLGAILVALVFCSLPSTPLPITQPLGFLVGGLLAIRVLGSALSDGHVHWWNSTSYESFMSPSIHAPDLLPGHVATVQHLRNSTPQLVFDTAKRAKALFPKAQLRVHYLGADPVLSLTYGDDRIFLCVWDENGMVEL